jgi:hypothetical protein
LEVFIFVLVVAVLVFVVLRLRNQRKRAAAMDLEDKTWLRRPEPEPDPLTRRAPVRDFHVSGSEAIVSFDVPLGDEDDPVLNELLVDEAVEVLREKRHSLPIDDVTEIVVLAGRPESREIGRTKLPSPGQLPPPVSAEILNFSHVAKDPFASHFDADQTLQLDTKVEVPKDDLGPLRDELRIPTGLLRGLRARGIDPDKVGGAELIMAILELFDYHVTPQPEPGTHMASKDGVLTFVRIESHVPGSYPEVDENVIRKFVVEFSASGAQRGLMISDKYSPYMIHDVERHEPRIRFITRERAQRFIDSMAMG